MGLSDRIKIYIDVVTDGAKTGLMSFKTAISEAEGVGGKFKAGLSSAFDTVKANAGLLATAGAAAFAKLAEKSVTAFQDTALAAGKFAAASGIGVEAASRWIEVAGDIGISAETMQGAFQKFNKAVADGKPSLEAYGVQIVRTKDGMIDANATFQNAITTIGHIEDPTKRAKAAQELFGKSYGQLSELMGMSADKLKSKLDSVSDAKVISPEELEKAKKFRDALDNLHDIGEDLMIEFGESLVPMLTDFANAITTVDGFAKDITGDHGGLGKLYAWTLKYGTMIGPLVDGFKAIGNAITDDVSASMADGAVEAAKAAKALKDTGDNAADAAPDLRTFSDAAHDAERATIAARVATEDYNDRLDKLRGKLDQREAVRSFEEAMFTYRGSLDQSEASTDEYIGKLADTVDALNGIPAEVKTQMIAQLDEGNLAWVESRLTWVTRNRTVNINGQLVGADLRNAMEGRATGGPVNAGQPYVVGDNPDGSLNATSEVFVPGQSGTIVPADKVRQALGQKGTQIAPSTTYVDSSTTIMNFPVGATPRDVTTAQRRYRRTQGPT